MSLISQLAGEAAIETPKPKPNHAVEAVKVIPYDASTDPNAEVMLPWLWNRLKEDGLVDLYFPNNPAPFVAFVRMMSGGLNVFLATTQDEEGNVGKLIGFLTWEHLNFGGAKTAMAGFIFLKEFWDAHISKAAAHALMTHLFENTEVEVAVGNVAEKNRLASLFLAGIGWQKVGKIPGMQQYNGERTNANLWCMTKEDFYRGQG